MQPNTRDFSKNTVLSGLPESELAVFAPHLRRVDLRIGDDVERLGEAPASIYFPLTGLVSQMVETDDGRMVETYTIGCESCTGLSMVLGSDHSPMKAVVQVAGVALQAPTPIIQAASEDCPSFGLRLRRRALVALVQTAYGSACNRLHPVETRCARWLLSVHDRVEGDTFQLTQEYLASMLGVTRPSVSVAAATLQRAGLIRYRRGLVEVLDRAGLEAAACNCYHASRAELHRLTLLP